MKTRHLTTALLILICLGSVARADAPLVFCQCSEGEWGMVGQFWYYVDSASYPMMEFSVGTNDLDTSNYTNVNVPPGWNFSVVPEGMSHACGLFAPHGEMSEGPCYSLTAGRAHWWTDDPAQAIEFFTFGYDHPWRGEDVGWILVTRREGSPPQWYTFIESWDSPVGTGFGPLHGPWAPPPPCWWTSDCGETDYCAKEVGDCWGEGVCLPRPLICPPCWDPVCGCDGQTYANACVAAVAGESVDYWGACEGTPCWYNEDCGENSYCFFEECAQETGECRLRPESCPDVWEPVCGCDGITYMNACYAAMEGMSIDYEGPCEGSYCWSNDDCDPDDYCFFHVCAAETGVCMPRPESCPDVWEPVCGCDGITYPSACVAALEGMSIDYEGPCEGSYCWSNDDCDPDDYCFFHVCAAETGVCMPRPEFCPDIWDPVCGCDGITYPSACVAALEGMSIDYEGPCEGSYCWSNDDCDPDDYCFFHVCAAETGVCMPRPITCPYLWAPVCGCDGLTYANDCLAAYYGMSVDFHWACDAGDLDEDGDVDMVDFEAFTACMYGPGNGIPLPCEKADLDYDVDVDLRDFQGFQEVFDTPAP